MSNVKEHIILCNNAASPKVREEVKKDVLKLDYLSANRNVIIKMPSFVNSLYHLPNKIKDLLEIAAFIYTADRNIKRGQRDDVEYQSWARRLHFYIKVRDFAFWNRPELKQILIESLKFVSGDYDFDFTFQDGHNTMPQGLFDSEQFALDPAENTRVVLFSGGLDSLSGIVELLETTTDKLCLVSHRSGQPGTKKTQDKLFQALQRDYEKRCSHYTFSCNLTGVRAVEETQRTRSFLYCSIAFAISHTLGLDRFYVYENGITSLNFAKRQDLINARASRTTHPKTIGLFSKFFYLFHDNLFIIEHPFLFNTKTDILAKIKKYKREEYIDSAVSCSKTFKKDWDSGVDEYNSQALQCGGCSQCIDRRFAAFASETTEYDAGHLYKSDFIRHKMNAETKTTIMDYVRQARKYSRQNIDDFFYDTLEFTTDVVDFLDGDSEEDKINRLHNLFITHGKQIENAIRRMESPFDSINEGSFLALVSNRDYLKPDVTLLAEKIEKDLRKALPMMFHNGNLPNNEQDLNNKINSLIERNRNDYEREYPAIKFGLARIVPDHSFHNLLIETKYLRGGTTPSKATDGLSADMFKLPEEAYKLLVVYDPQSSISDIEEFSGAFENKSNNCKVCIIK